MSRASLAMALLASSFLHLVGLAALAVFRGSLQVPLPPPDLIAAELVVEPLTSQPVILPEPEPVTPPKIIEEADLTPAEPSSPPVPQPPRIVAQPDPTRGESHPKVRPSSKPIRMKTRVPSQSSEPPPAPPIPTEPAKSEEPLQKPIDGGEAGAVERLARGEMGGAPRSGAGEGSGDTARAGLGRGGTDGGTPEGGTRTGIGGGLGRTTRPMGGYQVRPRYPEAARQRGIEGTVLLKVWVTEQGRVEAVEVSRSAGYQDLDQAAMEAVRRWRFEPARRGREPVAVWVLIPVEFKLQ